MKWVNYKRPPHFFIPASPKNYKMAPPFIIKNKARYLIFTTKYAIPLKWGQNSNIKVVIFIILVLIP